MSRLLGKLGCAQMDVNDYKFRKHPGRHDLFAYAEMLADRRGPLPGALAAHVASCPQCTTEVKGMRLSLEFAAAAAEFTPAEDFTSRILLDAKRVRTHQTRKQRRQSIAMSAVRGVAYAATLAIISVITFAAVLGDPSPESHAAAAPPAAPAPTVAAAPQANTLEKTAEQVKTLSAAVSAKDQTAPPSLREREQLRAATLADGDIEAALNALERNPGNARAAQIVQSSLTQQAETLRDLYVERSL